MTPPPSAPELGVRAVVLMGVCGSGKTTVGRLLAASLGWSFHDADNLHPPDNVRKMASGRPLDDDDRAPWLVAVRRTIDELIARGLVEPERGGVVACSALRHAYREVLGVDRREVRLVHLTGAPELLAERLRERQGHYMPADLLQSQLDTLEPPRDALTLDVGPRPVDLARCIVEALGLGR